MSRYVRHAGRVATWGATAILLAGSRAAAQDKAPSSYEGWVGQRQATVANPDVIAYYDFQGGQGPVLANSAKGAEKLDGSIKGATWVEGRWPGKKALKFNGTSDYVEIPSTPCLFPFDAAKGGAGELTIEVWLKASSEQESGVVDKSSGGNGPEGPYMVWISPHRLGGLLGDGQSYALAVEGEDLPTGKWTHVALTVDGVSVKLYRDGALVAQGARSVAPMDNGKPVLIGWMGGGKFFFNGAIDEVALYRKALSGETIKSHALNFAVAVPPPPDVPIALTAPNGGEQWAVGSRQVVRWTGGNAGAEKIEHSPDSGKSWTAIGTAPSRDGRFLWTVPDPVSKECKVRISDAHQSVESKATFSTLPSQAAAGYKWINVTMNGPFAPRDGCGALVFQNKMWLLGGWNPRDKAHFPRICVNEVWSSQDGLNWTLVKPNTFIDATFNGAADWAGRHTAGNVVFKDKMWIVGADAIQNRYESDVWNSSDGKSWTRLTDKAPWGPRVLHYTLVFRDKIWVIGGQTCPQFAPAEEHFYRDIWNTSDGVKWEKVEPKEPYWPQRGMIGGYVVFNDRIWILGGGTYDTPQRPKRLMYSDVWSSADGVNWQCHTAEAPWMPREYHDVAVFDGKMWVLEGWNNSNRNDVWYSSDGANWYELPNTPWAPRHAASVMTYDNALWMILGNNMEPDVWKLVRTPEAAK